MTDAETIIWCLECAYSEGYLQEDELERLSEVVAEALGDEKPTLIDDQPITDMPSQCTIFGCGGTLFNSGGLMICSNCGRSYGEA
jgi:hypothetical protein